MVRFCEGQLPLFPGTHASLVSYCLGAKAFRRGGGYKVDPSVFLESSLCCVVGGVCFFGQICVLLEVLFHALQLCYSHCAESVCFGASHSAR